MVATNRRAEIERVLKRGKAEVRTYAEIAADAGIRPSTLACWAWRLRREDRLRGPVERAGRPGQQFVELSGSSRGSDVPIEIELKSGRRIVTTSDVDSRTLASIVEALDPC